MHSISELFCICQDTVIISYPLLIDKYKGIVVFIHLYDIFALSCSLNLIRKIIVFL